MDLVILTLAVFGTIVAVLLWLGNHYPGTGAEQLDWKPAISYEDQVRLESEDLEQMIEAHNERRRRSGRPELTEDDVHASVRAHEADLVRRAGQAGEDAGAAPSPPGS